ncbi:SET domain-containing protein SmydA-8-like [Thrips palmi]|uniref:SET domain-containing protein SmydA-8-like n=1 Tax=Thrips palmi TaxID=161013 RepID=A0A6P8ZNE6_THRPL|nr:SET domain-containing protein SmydA-8-like [Thrips palmi]XP_034242219.1 SET domain-containing protein SmydA-8-like [Thrips palmi]XP_034242220.1 SET domain-containing protein SmydA-8-like [Thrips palmi]
MSSSRPVWHNAATAPCAVCGAEGRPCSRCRVHYYCGAEHQRQHWAKHRHGCGSVALEGGVLVAVKDIPANTCILRELPSVVFPCQPHFLTKQDVVLCVACCVDVSGSYAQCGRCGLPVCNDTCSQSSSHQAECQAFQEAEFVVPKADIEDEDVPVGTAVWILRAALASLDNPLLDYLLQDLGFGDKPPRRLPAVWETVNLKVNTRAVRYLCDAVGIKRLSERDLHRAAHMVISYASASHGPLVNKEGQKPAHVGVLFVGLSLRKHSCFPNSADRVMKPRTDEYMVVTTRDVAAGQCITINRQGGTWFDHTRERRKNVMLRWGFVCDCERCSDPTELGMYVDSPCCAACAERGKQCFLVPVGDEIRNDWSCEGCKKSLPLPEVKGLTKPAEDRLEELLDSSTEELLKFIAEHSYPRGPLHPTHALVLRARKAFLSDNHLRRAMRHMFQLKEVGLKLLKRSHREQLQISMQFVTGCVEVITEQLRALNRLLPGLTNQRLSLLCELRWLTLFKLDWLKTAARCLRTPETEQNMAHLTESLLDVEKQIRRHFFFLRDDDEMVQAVMKSGQVTAESNYF